MSDHIINGILAQRANAWEQAKAINEAAVAENRSFTGEEQASWDKAMADIDALDARAKAIESAETRAKEAEGFLANVEKRGVTGPVKGADAEPGFAERLRAFAKGETRSFEYNPVDSDIAEVRALTKGSATAGGNTVPQSFYGDLVRHLIQPSGILRAGAKVVTTAQGQDLPVPKTTTHASASIVAENATISTSDAAFGQVVMKAFKYGYTFKVSPELLADEGVDLEAYFADWAGTAIGNGFGAHAITGTGTTQPRGIVTDATLGVTGAASVAGAFNYANLVDLKHSVAEIYRRDPSTGWLMADSTVGATRKIVDTQGRPIWEPSVQAGTPDVLLGHPVFVDPNVAAVALSAKSVVFGAMNRYFVRMVNGVRFERSLDFAFDTDMVTFRVLARLDGALIDTTGAVKYFAGNAA